MFPHCGSGAQEALRKVNLLKERAADYVKRVETASPLDYGDLPTDRLLIVDALNTRSVGTLGEAGEVQFTYAGADPACATSAELSDLLARLCEPWVADERAFGELAVRAMTDAGITQRAAVQMVWERLLARVGNTQ